MATKSETSANPMFPLTSVTDSFDDFTGNDEYKSDTQSLPWVQTLNKSEDIERAGLFVTQENVDKSNFSPDENWEPFKKKFGEGDPVTGFRTITPNFSVIHTSPLYMRNREGDLDLIPFDKKTYNSALQTPVTRYLFVFLSKDNKPLNYIPLQFTAKGSVCGSFGAELRKIKEEINKIVGSQMGPRFFALWRNALQLDTVIKGEKQLSSWVTTVCGHESILGKTHFFGRNTGTKDLIEMLFDEYKDFGTLTKKAPQPEEIVADDSAEAFADIPF
jgi:Family of unknown function (DUF5895)